MNLRRVSAFSAFTVAELVVTIAVLAVLSAVGFLALSGYRQDAADAATKSNVRSVYSAIVTESASTGNSPRYYVIHDPNYSLSGGVVVFDGVSHSMAGGDWNAPGTNYSAGNPDYAKFRMDREKFKAVAFGGSGILPFRPFGRASATETADPDYLLVGAASAEESVSGKTRLRSYAQVAGILSSSTSVVVGDYAGFSGSVAGLVKDVANPDSDGALVDGAAVGSVPGCDAGTVSGYPVPDLASGQSAPVSKTTSNGTVSATASCYFGTVSVSSESVSCASGYVASAGPSCVADVCGSTVPANASSTATSQSVSGTWHYAASAGQCTFACNSNYSWDGSACRASCQVPVSETRSSLTYALSSSPLLPHGQSASLSGTSAFGAAPANGALTAGFSYSCSDGALSKSDANGTGSCQPNFTWNGSWSAPSCAADSRTASCGGSVPANGAASTSSTYPQTWNGTAWTPALSWTAGAPACGYSCDANYVPSGGACVGASRTASCAGLPLNASWNTVSSITQTWNGAAWSPSSVGSYDGTASVTECRFKCALNYTWNAVTCSADTRTFACAAKPAAGTVWNSVSSYTQTWNGTAWSPADSTTAYNTAASATSCRYACASGYGWDFGSSSCKASVGGSCGTANRAYAYGTASYGADAYCSSGSPSSSPAFPAPGASATWTCSGQYGGSPSTTCTASQAAPANCAASAQTVNGHSYSVSAFNHGTTTSPTSVVAITNGSRTYRQIFSCSNGIVSASGGESNTANACNTNYTWNGSSCAPDTQTFTCAAKPATGTVWNSVSSYTQTWNGSTWIPANSTTTYNATASTTSCRYECSSTYVWDSGTSSCKPIVNGACGSSDGLSLTSKPTTGLCSQGTASAVSGTGPWTWTCASTNGGTTDSCSAADKCDTVPTTKTTFSDGAGLLKSGEPIWVCMGTSGSTCTYDARSVTAHQLTLGKAWCGTQSYACGKVYAYASGFFGGYYVYNPSA